MTREGNQPGSVRSGWTLAWRLPQQTRTASGSSVLLSRLVGLSGSRMPLAGSQTGSASEGTSPHLVQFVWRWAPLWYWLLQPGWETWMAPWYSGVKMGPGLSDLQLPTPSVMGMA